MYGVRAVVVMAENATPSKIEATRAYGAEVVLHGSIWDEANERAKELVASDGLTYVHPFDDVQLIAGQATLGLEIVDDLPSVDTVVVPIGGGGLSPVLRPPSPHGIRRRESSVLNRPARRRCGGASIREASQSSTRSTAPSTG